MAASTTLKAIASRLGLSATTVSRSLSGQGARYRISPGTQDAVRRLAARLGFSPDPIARGLRLKKTGTIGLVIPDVSNPFFARIAHCVTVAAGEQGHSVLLADSQERTPLEIEAIATLLRRRVDGLIVCPVGLSDAHLTAVGRGRVPLVLVDRYFPRRTLPSVTSDNAGGARAATRHLLAAGHRRIGVLQGLPGTSTNRDRLAGHRAALSSRRVRHEPSLVAGETFLEESGYRAAKRLLRTRSRPTALFALGNLIALGALRAIRELRLDIPGQLSFVAFDDHPYADHLATPVTTVAQDADALGRIAADALFSMLQGQPAKIGRHVVPTRLVCRSSVRPIRPSTERKT